MITRACLLALLAGCSSPTDDDAKVAEDMVKVPAGAFEMGCNPGLRPELCEPDELPYRTVVVAGFAIDRTEVTQGAYAKCVADRGCAAPTEGYDPSKTPDLPVTFVLWEQADQFCLWRGARLPTEAEWEKAARGSDGRLYPWGNDAPNCDRTHFAECGNTPRAVGALPLGASPYGALDLAGNVMEWTADRYDPASELFHVQRGGSFIGDPQTVRVSNRVKGFPIALSNVGFRCVRSL